MAHSIERGRTGPGTAGSRVLTVAALDSVPVYREGLNAVVSRTPGLRWVGHAATQHASMQLCEQLHPNIVAVDSGLDPQGHLIRLLSDGHPMMIIVVLLRQAHVGATFISAMLSAGAHGVVPRDADPRRLGEALRKAFVDRRYTDPSLAPLLTRQRHTTGGDGRAGAGVHRPRMPLSRREYQVLQLVAEGLENAAIAKTLFLSVETVRTHVKSILRKLSARDRTHAVSKAFRSGILVARAEGAPPGEGEAPPAAVGNTIA
ncbi:response regulator containing a CheY-like receiver domain and an HTH DNA-binding domain [Saccharomonospora marina XMU15]|uniref:Response regulator containing a CheY-like receiver domain and an HTH DNA-binding domain n=1 Tax=Saccharomonospora marina XMU15 TaxID=882083 RepID=H5XB58_9PSEU|nr:response regulator transcription factor [Saccharomonospora marina]EHR53788.1 response regulator containing a CheY-like receiver domain and an HTH DNA-binding domain [Saccharomonospora marina XMU15]